MKLLMPLLFVLPMTVHAQDDTCGLKKSKDPFTNVQKLSTGFKKFDGNNLTVAISADATPTDIDFFIWVKNSGKCFDAESTAQLVWEGERVRATFHNTGSMNCDGAFHFVFKNIPETQVWLRKMIAKRVATIKLIGNNNVESLITLDDSQKAAFQKMASCIAAGAKTLLPKP